MFFGLIHGLGFSNYLQSLLGKEDNVITPLFAFNIGVELGQLIIVMIVLIITYFFIEILKVKRREWNLIISGAGIGIALIMVLERIPW